MIPLVVCIDDDSIALFISKINLKKTNFCEEIISFEKTVDAIDYFEKQIKQPENQKKIPNLIFLDLNMPEINGWDFIEIFSNKFNALLKQTKIVLLSSTVNPLDKSKAISNPYVFKLIDKASGFEHLNELKKNPDLSVFFKN